MRFFFRVNRDNANQALPMLNKIMGYPTTIFIDKKGRVRKIHTGFSGPRNREVLRAVQRGIYNLCRMAFERKLNCW